MAVSDYDTVVAADSPVHYYKLNEASGNITDHGSGSKDLTSISGVTYQTDNIILAYPSRDGVTTNSSGIVGLASASTYSFPGGDLTAEIFVKSNGGFDTQRSVFNGGTPWNIQINTSAIYFVYRSGGVDRTVTFSALSIPHNVITHIMVRVSGTSLTVVANGAIGTATLAGTIDSGTSQPITLGGRGNILSHASIYHSALSDARIVQHVRAGWAADSTADIYCDDAGSASNPGSSASPIDFATAGKATYLVNLFSGSGGTLRVKSGVQNLPVDGWQIYLQGSAGNVIQIKPETGEAKILLDSASCTNEWGTTEYETHQGSAINFATSSQYVEFWNPEVFNSDGDVANNRGRGRPDGIDVQGIHIKLISPWIYDTGQGSFLSTSCNNFEMHGALIFNNGMVLHTTNGVPGLRPAGHGMYVQNISTSARQITKNSVMWGQFNFGFHAYGTATTASGMDADGIISFNNGDWLEESDYQPALAFVATKKMIQNTLRRSVSFRGGTSLGAVGDPHSELDVEENLFIGAPQIVDFNKVNFNDNFIVSSTSTGLQYNRPVDYSGLDPSNNAYSLDHAYSYGGLKGQWTGTGNTYAGPGFSSGSTNIFTESGVGTYTLAQWQALTNIDADATLRNTTSSPITDPIVKYKPNEYESGKGFIAIYNPALSNNVTIDLTTFGLTEGQAFSIYDCQNPPVHGSSVTPVLSGTYNAATPTESIDMTGTTVRAPIGYTYDGTLANRTTKEFKAFMVIPGAAASGTPDTPTAVTVENNVNGVLIIDATIDPTSDETSLSYRENGGAWSTPEVVTLPHSLSVTFGATVDIRLKDTNESGDSAWSDTKTVTATVVYSFGARPSIEGFD